ncbi:haloacid dehalogenase [Arthrobacter rhombi]|uniref:HAD family hydrolase n=1 Tax=Arthrobacter rhombi TaxID=71253 RepID=UPI0031DB3321
MRRFVVFDLDGVVREFRSEAANDIIETRLGLAPGTVDDLAFGGPELMAAVTGQITFEQWAASIVERLVILSPDRRAVVSEFARWTHYRGDLVPETVDLLDELNEQGHPVFAFTNGTSLIPREMRGHGLEHRFRAVVNSADLGFKKPDPRAFGGAHQVIESHVSRAVGRSEIIFVDDRLDNVEAARAFGWQAVHFGSVEDTVIVRSLAGLPD